jgi:invasion protein IalB
MPDKYKKPSILSSAKTLTGAIIVSLASLSAASAQEAATEAAAPETYVAATHGDWTVRCAGVDPAAAAPAAGATEDDDGKGDLGDETAEETPAVAATPQERPQCVMVQIARHSDQEDLGISVIVVRQVINGDLVSQMRITTPISVFLPAGVGLEIDAETIGRLPYEVCSPAGVCVATVFVDETLEGQFKRGGTAQFYLKDVRGTDGIFALSLSGFTAAFDALNIPDS